MKNLKEISEINKKNKKIGRVALRFGRERMESKCCIFDDVERKMIVKDESLEITRVSSRDAGAGLIQLVLNHEYIPWRKVL